jgi:hypothetical protein
MGRRRRTSTACKRRGGQYGQLSGIDPDEPFNGLRFTEQPTTAADVSTMAVEIVHVSVSRRCCGFIPTTTQETVVVERLGTINLRALPDPPPTWLAGLNSGARVWLIEGRRPTATSG